MKKQYTVVSISKKDLSSSIQGEPAERVPIIKIEGVNSQILNGRFELPEAKSYKDSTIEVAFRVLGIVITNKLLEHLPKSIPSDAVGQLIPYVPFNYHKHFVAGYSDRVCIGSLNDGRCPICEYRAKMFSSEEYRSGKITKEAIIGAGFLTRSAGLTICRVFMNGEDMGLQVFATPLTNEFSRNAQHNNFFDIVETLKTPKKLLSSEVLPMDYYANGDGARWLIAEYSKSTYSGSFLGKSFSKEFWKLMKITPAKEIPNLGKAEDVWYPTVKVDGNDVDGIDAIDIYGLFNCTPADELLKLAKSGMEHVLESSASVSLAKEEESEKADEKKDDGGTDDGGAVVAEQAPVEKEAELPVPTWEELNNMDVETLVKYGVQAGADAESMECAGATNKTVLRNAIAKLYHVKPTK